MSFSQRLDLFNSFTNLTNPSILFPSQQEILEMEFNEPLGFALDILSPNLCPKSPFFDISSVHPFIHQSWPSDLTSISFLPSHTEIQLQTLRNRISALELGFDRAIRAKNEPLDRKFKWTAEIKGGKEGSDRKYKLMAEMKAGGERSLKWTTDVKGKGSYSFEAETIPAVGSRREIEKEKKGEKKKKGVGSSGKIVEIEEGINPGVVAIRKVCV